MNKEWKDSQLIKLHSGKSIFHYVPNNIGNIVYCDTTESREFPYSKKYAKRRKIKGTIFAIICLSLLWGLLYEHYIWASILTLVILLVAFSLSDVSFNGTDYFVGDKGFSIISFEDNRDNITNNKTFLFDDISYLFTGETIRKVNFSYVGTNYYFTLYKNISEETQIYNLAYTVRGSYSDKSPKDPMNPKDASHDYTLMKIVEKQWTLYFISKHINDDVIEFSVLKEDKLLPYIRIEHDSLNVAGVEYNRYNTKKIYYSNGNIIIEHINHSKKLFGLIEKGNITGIPLSDLGNRQAFLLLFDNFYKS